MVYVGKSVEFDAKHTRKSVIYVYEVKKGERSAIERSPLMLIFYVFKNYVSKNQG